MGVQKRQASRVRFEGSYPAKLMGIDGTWHRACLIEDISETGARVSIEGSMKGLQLAEFFLVLSTQGAAHRRCKMIWLTGEMMGLRFRTKSIGEPAERRRRRATPTEGVASE